MIRSDSRSRLDRWLHEFAFRTWPLQLAVADLEDVIFRGRLDDGGVSRPVFIAGLPRAGTTLLLELVADAGEFASLRYRDMPFLLTPLLWSEATRSAKRSSALGERAHGDGMLIGVDSPEAFEEVVWRTHFPRRYRGDRLSPWPAQTGPDMKAFFPRYMAKVVAARRGAEPRAQRYLSKNNGNIARLPAIRALAPDAIILVPFRDPVAQAMSLLTQHLGFLELHRQDRFAQRYMEAIGHYDFGANLKPIDFGHWLGPATEGDFEKLETWVRYWTATYAHLADQAQDLELRFVSFDALCRAPGATLQALEAVLQVEEPGVLSRGAGRVRPPEPAPEAADLDPEALRAARRVHRDLEARAVR